MSTGHAGRHPARGYLLVLGAGTLWGTLGLFYTGITHRYNVHAETIAFFRAATVLIILLSALAYVRRNWLHIRRRDLPLFIGQGVIGIAAFYLVYAYAIHVAGMSVEEDRIC